MALKTFKPTTPSLRQLVIVDRSELYKGKPVKTLTEGKSSKGGRNNLGRITVRFRGGVLRRDAAGDGRDVPEGGRLDHRVGGDAGPAGGAGRAAGRDAGAAAAVPM